MADEKPRVLPARLARKLNLQRIAKRAEVVNEHIGNERPREGVTPLAAAHFALKAHVGGGKRKRKVRG